MEAPFVNAKTAGLANDDPSQQTLRAFFAQHAGVTQATVCTSTQEAVQKLQDIYNQHVHSIQEALLKPALLEEILSYQKGTYPYLGFFIEPHHLCNQAGQVHGIACAPGFYGTTITRPHLFSEYLTEQIQSLITHHGVLPIVGHSQRVIPLPFLSEDVLMQIKDFSRLSSFMSLPSLRDIDDQIANGTYDWAGAPIKPLSLFTAERVDYSLGRLMHYCGTDIGHFQKFILLTNYQRYVDLFFDYAKKVLADPTSGYTGWSEPNNQILTAETIQEDRIREAGQLYQMPAYHLMRENGMGITLINIGVGTTNAKNITDHLAVLRPHCWIMIGHCAGLRHDQVLGDYVMAHGYVRNDHVIDEDLPTWIPIPPLLEIEDVLKTAIQQITGMTGPDFHAHVRSGTVVSTGNRNWELRIKELTNSFHMSRAIALDMESATLSANGFRFRVPYGALLCVSDRPLHGELKLQGMAKNFYRQRVQQHLDIGIRAMELIRHHHGLLHSHKLRGLQEPPFR